MRKAEIIASLVLIATGLVFLFYLIPEQTAEGDGMGMAPDTLPVITMGIITGLAVLLLLFNLFIKKEQDDAPPILTENVVNIFKFSALLAIGAALINFAGFIIGSILMIAGFNVVSGGSNPVKIALVSVIPTLIVYLLLRYAFNAPLP